MNIVAYNHGHDGAVASLEDGRLRCVTENEKDSGIRYSSLSPSLFVRSLQSQEPPDVVAISGSVDFRAWLAGGGEIDSSEYAIAGGYFDVGQSGKSESQMLISGKPVHLLSSSHARSHIMCSYGLSPFPQGQPCYALVWEGIIGSFYYIDEHVQIRKVCNVLEWPGYRYALLYDLATRQPKPWDGEAAGKVMALAAYGRDGSATSEEQETIDAMMSLDVRELYRAGGSLKPIFGGHRLCSIGVEEQEFKDFARQFSAALFQRFYECAKQHVKPGVPLLISGGCALNCDWNSQWRTCGLFSDVFVPPCANDSGVALGAAIDALHNYTGSAKLEWNVYCGERFLEDVETPADFECATLDLADVCRGLLDGDVVAWVQGCYEMGPRALGNRSLLAAPFSSETRDRLNKIKQRERFRPVAPICVEEDFSTHFEHVGPSPHMLYFQRVKSKRLAAVTHVDGSARAQSVNETENAEICALLREFRRQSGVGVMCNTSLNFKGYGFINRSSHLFKFARERGIDRVVVGTRSWRRRESAVAP